MLCPDYQLGLFFYCSPRHPICPSSLWSLHGHGSKLCAFLLMMVMAALLFHPPAVQHVKYETRVSGSLWTWISQSKETSGQPRWRSGLAPPAAWGVILEIQDRVPHRAPCMEPASPSACVSASLSLSCMNK